MSNDEVVIVVQRDKSEHRFRTFEDEQAALVAVCEMSKARSATIESIIKLNARGATVMMTVAFRNGRLVFEELEMTPKNGPAHDAMRESIRGLGIG